MWRVKEKKCCSSKKVPDVYGENVLTVRHCQNGLAKFRSCNFDIEDAQFSERVADKNTDRLNLSNSTIRDHLKDLSLNFKAGHMGSAYFHTKKFVSSRK